MSASPIGKTGVLTISGYGLKVLVRSGHLRIEDGIGPERRKFSLPRISNLRRLVCIGSDGFVTLSALKFISDIGAAFIMLDRMGKVLFVTGPSTTADGRLHRSQALSLNNGTALTIRLTDADNLDKVRVLEAHAAAAYWSVLSVLPVMWSKADLRKIPEHWHTVGSRHSPLTGSPRLAVTPVHAIWNYLFSV